MSEKLEGALAELRRPFTLAAVRWRVLTRPYEVEGGHKAGCIYYIDARLVAERLNAAVGLGSWSDSYRVLYEENPGASRDFHFPVECTITVLGVSKTDVGVYQQAKADEVALKGAYSDAFKRAGVKFGIGAYLSAIPRVQAPVDVRDGKARGLTEAGDTLMRKAYERWLGHELNRFGEPFDHGDVLLEDVTEDS